jgi:transforming growth factor-beta-induced protein
LLGLPELSDILLYHVLGTEVPSSAVTNGALVQPLNIANTLKMTVTGAGDVFVNQAEVTAVDIMADNGVVHVLDAVVLPIETVADVAIDNGFSTLVTAVVTAELLPALSDPFSEYTVFAPTNQAFSDLATALNTDLNGILALPNLQDILLYHVVGGTVLSTQLTAGPVATLEGSDVIVSLTGGVKINDANVTTADVPADNGVVHVLDKVILESYLGINENNAFSFSLFPNPSNGLVTINGVDNAEVIVSDLTGKTFVNQRVNNNTSLDLNGLSNGTYLVTISQHGNQSVQTLVKF